MGDADLLALLLLRERSLGGASAWATPCIYVYITVVVLIIIAIITIIIIFIMVYSCYYQAPYLALLPKRAVPQPSLLPRDVAGEVLDKVY